MLKKKLDISNHNHDSDSDSSASDSDSSESYSGRQERTITGQLVMSKKAMKQQAWKNQILAYQQRTSPLAIKSRPSAPVTKLDADTFDTVTYHFKQKIPLKSFLDGKSVKLRLHNGINKVVFSNNVHNTDESRNQGAVDILHGKGSVRMYNSWNLNLLLTTNVALGSTMATQDPASIDKDKAPYGCLAFELCNEGPGVKAGKQVDFSRTLSAENIQFIEAHPGQTREDLKRFLYAVPGEGKYLQVQATNPPAAVLWDYNRLDEVVQTKKMITERNGDALGRAYVERELAEKAEALTQARMDQIGFCNVTNPDLMEFKLHLPYEILRSEEKGKSVRSQPAILDMYKESKAYKDKLAEAQKLHAKQGRGKFDEKKFQEDVAKNMQIEVNGELVFPYTRAFKNYNYESVLLPN